MRAVQWTTLPEMSYTPSCYAITHKGIDCSSQDQLPVELDTDRIGFFHEYLHYIQDISTYSGLLSFLSLSNNATRLYDLLKDIKTENTISLPLPESAINLVRSYNHLTKFRDGNTQTITDKFQITSVPIISETTFADEFAYNLKIPIEDETLEFGLNALQECHVYYAQQVLEGFTGSKYFCSLPYFPYKTIDLLFDYYEITGSAIKKFLLIDLALDCVHPLVLIDSILKQYTKKNLDDFTPICIVKEIRNLPFNIQMEEMPVNKQVEDAIQHFNNFKTLDDLSNTFKWIVETTYNAIKYRLDLP